LYNSATAVTPVKNWFCQWCKELGIVIGVAFQRN